MQRADAVRLRHMLDAAREAMTFAQGRDRSDLDSDRMLVLSLVKDIEIVGEAAYQSAEAVRSQLPDIPWNDIIGIATGWYTPTLTSTSTSFGRLCR